jgi:branched-chain amino acid transport system permease protein
MPVAPARHAAVARGGVLIGILVGALGCLPLLYSNNYVLHLLVLASINVILACGLNISTGYTNQISLAQGALCGVGAYASALAALTFGLSFWVTLPLSAVFTGLVGLLLAVPTLRVHGHYLAITTLGFQMVINLTMSQWYSVTRGAFGIGGIPGVASLGTLSFQSLRAQYYLYAGLAMLGVYLLRRVVGSTVGLEMVAVREEEQAAACMGIHVSRTRVLALTMSAVYAGVAGCMLAHYMGSISPREFDIWESVMVLAMVLIGGRGTVVGPVIGAVVLTLAPELLRQLSNYRLIVYGLLMMVIVVFLPNGLVGVLRRPARDVRLVAALGSPSVDAGSVPAGN